MAAKTTVPPEVEEAHDLITAQISALDKQRINAGPDADLADQVVDQHLAGRIAGLNEALSLMFRAVINTGKAAKA